MPELPLEIWRDRLENEIRTLERLNVLERNSLIRNEDNIELVLKIKALGFLKEDSDLIPKKYHRVFLKINRTFPYPGGIDFSWQSEIFHPNVHPTEHLGSDGNYGTGYICLNVLKRWSRLSDLETTVKALQMLIENPNPDDPLNYDICLEAADFFRDNPMEDIREKFDLDAIEDEEDDDDDDDIIIIDD